MEQKQLEVQKRSETGKGAVRRLRKEGIVPAVVYYAGQEAKTLQLSNHDLLMAVRGCRPTQIFNLKSEDKALDGTLAFIKDVQTEPIKDRVLHVDFLEVEAGRTVQIEVSIELTGEPVAVKQGLAVLEQRSYGLDVECLPKDIPAVITIDVSDLKPGDAILASDLPFAEGVSLRSSPDTTVVTVMFTRAASLVSGDAEEAEGEEGGDEAAESGDEASSENKESGES